MSLFICFFFSLTVSQISTQLLDMSDSSSAQSALLLMSSSISHNFGEKQLSVLPFSYYSFISLSQCINFEVKENKVRKRAQVKYDNMKCKKVDRHGVRHQY